jgi:hypothetical protein
MSVIYGVWFAFAGAVAALAGLSAMHRKRRLRRSGLTAWAMVVASPVDPDAPRRDQPLRISVQFDLPDGRVIERTCAESGGNSPTLIPGQRVLVWYDPADPGEVLVYGRGRKRADQAFLAAGVVSVMLGAGIAVFAR